MARKNVPLAIAYDFDWTLSPGYMQDYDLIPALGMKPKVFWDEVKVLAKDQQGDEILIYMGQNMSNLPIVLFPSRILFLLVMAKPISLVSAW